MNDNIRHFTTKCANCGKEGIIIMRKREPGWCGKSCYRNWLYKRRKKDRSFGVKK